VLRYWNNDVLTNREGVLASLFEQLSGLPPLPNPSPARGEGLKNIAEFEIFASPLEGEADARSAAGEEAAAQAAVSSRE
jgi:hypothetical protein